MKKKDNSDNLRKNDEKMRKGKKGKGKMVENAYNNCPYEGRGDLSAPQVCQIKW